jgi:hypothetical protein
MNAPDRPQAAGDDHGECKDDHFHPDAECYRDLWRHHRTAERAQHRSEHESEREHGSDVDPEGGRSFLIEHYDSEEPPVSSIFQRPMRRSCERGGKRDQAHVVAR